MFKSDINLKAEEEKFSMLSLFSKSKLFDMLNRTCCLQEVKFGSRKFFEFSR